MSFCGTQKKHKTLPTIAGTESCTTRLSGTKFGGCSESVSIHDMEERVVQIMTTHSIDGDGVTQEYGIAGTSIVS